MSDDETPEGRDDQGSTGPDEDASGSADGSRGSTGSEEAGQPGISDEELPDDVRPSEDNPLAYGPTDDDEDEGMSLGGPDGADGAGGQPA